MTCASPPKPCGSSTGSSGSACPASKPSWLSIVERADFYNVDRTVRMVSRESKGFETTYNLTEPRNHSYIVGGTVVANCTEYVHLDNSSCNLASINLLKFLRDDDTLRRGAVPADHRADHHGDGHLHLLRGLPDREDRRDYPCLPAARHRLRQPRRAADGHRSRLRLRGRPGDRRRDHLADDRHRLPPVRRTGRRGRAVRRLRAQRHRPQAGDAQARRRLPRDQDPSAAWTARSSPRRNRPGRSAWPWARQMATGTPRPRLLAPTGCLTGDTLVTTDRGLARLSELGDVYGDRWQDLDLTVSTDEGPRRATKFFVNGEEPTRLIQHRWRLPNPGHADPPRQGRRSRAPGRGSGSASPTSPPATLLPLQMGTLVGEPRRVPLPVLDQAYYAGDRSLRVPGRGHPGTRRAVGYFMGDGSLHAKGIRLCVADSDLDVAERLGRPVARSCSASRRP